MYWLALLVLPIISYGFVYGALEVFQNQNLEGPYWFFSPKIDYTIIVSILFISLLLGLFGNYFYYWHVRLKILWARRKKADVNSQRKYLSRSDSVSIGASVIGILLTLSLSYFGFSVLADKDRRATLQVNEAIDILNTASRKVFKYRKEHDKWPESTKDIAMVSGLYSYEYVERVTVLQRLIIITFKRHGVVDEFSGKSLALYGSEANGRIKWVCGSIDMPLAYLPKTCKRELKKATGL